MEDEDTRRTAQEAANLVFTRRMTYLQTLPKPPKNDTIIYNYPGDNHPSCCYPDNNSVEESDLERLEIHDDDTAKSWLNDRLILWVRVRERLGLGKG